MLQYHKVAYKIYLYPNRSKIESSIRFRRKYKIPIGLVSSF